MLERLLALFKLYGFLLLLLLGRNLVERLKHFVYVNRYLGKGVVGVGFLEPHEFWVVPAGGIQQDSNAFVDAIGFESDIGHLAVLELDDGLTAVKQLLGAQLGVEAKGLVEQVKGPHHRHAPGNVHAIHLFYQDGLRDVDVEVVLCYSDVFIGSLSVSSLGSSREGG